MPVPNVPILPQFQHSLGSVPCRSLLMGFRRLPRSPPYHSDPSGPQRPPVQSRRHGIEVTGIFPSPPLPNISVHGTRRTHIWQRAAGEVAGDGIRGGRA
jgi:hypothetical protein